MGKLKLKSKHRLLCGDSIKHKDCDRLFDGDVAAMCFTDPPYNVAYNKQADTGHSQQEITNDNMGSEEWLSFTQSIADTIKKYTDGCVYVFHAQGHDGRVMACALDTTLHWSSSIVWVKHTMVFGRATYQRRCEMIWFGWRPDANKTFTSDRTLTDVWEFNKPSRSDMHPTMKPIELVAQAVSHASKKNQVVFDPFMGSGTTLIACEQLNRRCYGMEIDPLYCDVIVKRWENLTGEKAVCNG